MTEVVGVHSSLQSVRVKNVFYHGNGDATTLVSSERLIPTYTIKQLPAGTKYTDDSIGELEKFQGGEAVEIAVDAKGNLVQGWFDSTDEQNNVQLHVGRGILTIHNAIARISMRGIYGSPRNIREVADVSLQP